MKNTVSRLAALVLALFMLLGVMSTGMAEESKFAERVPLDVVAFVGSAEADGLRTDPVSKYIEEALNIDLYLTAVNEADWPGQLSAMLADNDLPDIFMLSDPTKQLPMLIKSNSALAVDPYIDEYAPNLTTTPAGQLLLAAERLPASSPDGQMYMWGLCKGSWDDGTMPTCGHYLRWDLYAKAGYPEITGFDDSLLDAIEAMVALEPETADGQKVYGVGAWFGNGQDWGEWVFTYGLAPQSGVNFVTTSGRVLAISTIDSTPLENNQLTDPDSIFWTDVKFYNRANQRGLLDPDSFMMTSSVYEDNLKAGRYVFNIPGWMSGSSNIEYRKTDPNKMFISLPAIASDAEDRFGNMYKGERQYVINANTKYPERCVALLDFVSSYEFARITFNGLSIEQGGRFWSMEDGKPVPTDEFLDATKNDDLQLSDGVDIYYHFAGFGMGTIDPATGTYVDLYQYSDKANEQKLTDTMKDFIAHYGCTSQAEVYRTQTPVTDSMMFITFGEPEGDISSYVNEINAYMGTNIFKAVAAESDEAFEQVRDQIISDLQNNYHAEEVFEYFYNKALEQKDDVATLVELSNALK